MTEVQTEKLNERVPPVVFMEDPKVAYERDLQDRKQGIPWARWRLNYADEELDPYPEHPDVPLLPPEDECVDVLYDEAKRAAAEGRQMPVYKLVDDPQTLADSEELRLLLQWDDSDYLTNTDSIKRRLAKEDCEAQAERNRGVGEPPRPEFYEWLSHSIKRLLKDHNHVPQSFVYELPCDRPKHLFEFEEPTNVYRVRGLSRWRARGYDAVQTVSVVHRMESSFTNRMRSIDWDYYLQNSD